MKFFYSEIYVTVKKFGRIEADHREARVFRDDVSSRELFAHFEESAMETFTTLGTVPVILSDDPEVAHSIPLSRVKLFEFSVREMTEDQFDGFPDSVVD